MASTDRVSLLPSIPTDGQVFVDKELVKWIYNASLRLWERAGAVTTVPVASEDISGYMTSADKRKLDSIPAVGGGFGIIVDPNVNVDNIITGNIELKSESLDITCVSGIDGEKLKCLRPNVEFTCETPGGDDFSSAPGLAFSLSDKFLDSLIINIPAPTGPDGYKGAKGRTGDPGFGGGPRGDQGAPGESVDSVSVLKGIKIIDEPGVTSTAIAGLNLIEDEYGRRLVATIGELNFSNDDAASKVKAIVLDRSIVYPVDSDASTCMLTRLRNYTVVKPSTDIIPTDVLLLRLPNSDSKNPVGFSGSMSLLDFIDDIVTEYENKLKAIDKEWGEQVKEYINDIDDRARNILADLAHQLAMCEFNVPAMEYCIVLFNAPNSPSASAGFPDDGDGDGGFPDLIVESANVIEQASIGENTWSIK